MKARVASHWEEKAEDWKEVLERKTGESTEGRHVTVLTSIIRNLVESSGLKH